MSVATSLPVVNFGFEELRDRMNRFTIRFDEFLEKGRKRLLTEKNDFARDMAEARESARDVRAQIDHLKAAEHDIAEQMAREREEALEAERAIASMARTKAAKTDHRNALLAQIAHTETLIANKRSLRATERSSLLAHSSLNAPELEFWENYLGMRIESAGVPDHLRIVFTHIVENDWDREFRFVVALGPRDYQVLQCRPKVPDEVLDRVVGRLNESRNLTKFWKDMRDSFKEVAKREGAP